MEAPPRDERISLSCYESDLRTLRKLLVELGKREVRVKRTFLIRALTHTTPEPEILARTILQLVPTTGGTVVVSGEHIKLANAKIDASGRRGGGNVQR